MMFSIIFSIVSISCKSRAVPIFIEYLCINKSKLNSLKSFKNSPCTKFFTLYSSYLGAGCCFSKGKSETESPLISDMKRKIECSGSSSHFHSSEIENNAENYGTFDENSLDPHFIERNKRLKVETECNELETPSGDELLQNNICGTQEDSEFLISERAIEKKEELVDEPQATQSRKTKTKKPVHKKQRPNYFVAVKICDKKIHDALKEVQDHLVDQDKNLIPILTSLPTLHITLMVMYIGDKDTHERAVCTLEKIHKEYDDAFSKEPLKLEIKGLGTFSNRVLFAKVSSDKAYEQLSTLSNSVHEHFEAASIPSTDSRKAFNPHLTIAKITFNKKCKNIRKINPALYTAYKNQYFGHQTIKSIQLLSMTDPKDANGYFCGDELFFSAFESCSRLQEPICSPTSFESCSRSVEEKKKEVRSKIQALTKHLVKPM